MLKNNWKKYLTFSAASDERVNVYCILCQKNYKDNIGVFSNFLNHLKSKNGIEYKKSIKNDDYDDDLSEENVNIFVDRSITNSSPNKIKKKRINMAIGKNWIIKCHLRLSIIENSVFTDFINECSIKWQPISSKRLESENIYFLRKK